MTRVVPLLFAVCLLAAPASVVAEDKVPWDALTSVQWVPVGEGGDDYAIEWPEEALALKDTTITITGFMFPLDEASENQSHFLLTGIPMAGCTFCVDFGPESVIEIKLNGALEYSAGRITVTGKLELLEDDPTGLFYRIQKAKGRHGG